MAQAMMVQVDNGAVVGLYAVEAPELIHDVYPGEYLVTSTDSGSRVVDCMTGRTIAVEYGDCVFESILKMTRD